MSFHATLSATLARGTRMFEHHLADLSDADLLVRPVPGANHAAWQAAHVVHFTCMIARVVAPGIELPLTPAFEAAAARESAASDDPARFVPKAELIAVLRAAAEAIDNALARLVDADLGRPAPLEFQTFAPTLGQLILMVPLHLTLHLGQIQVIRRTLGKPNIF